MRKRLIAVFVAGGIAMLWLYGAFAGPMTLSDYMALDGPPPSAHIAYGPAPSQYVELFVPAGKGPFPVVFLVHGGCWSHDLGGIRQMHSIAGALLGRRIATWNVEYRRIDEAGGGYPGTYADINSAYDLLVAGAASYHLDADHVVAMGHSAGGHLVQWLAGRAQLPKSSPLYDPNPVRLRDVISLGGLADLKTQRDRIAQVCEASTEALAGRPSAARPDIFRDTSAAALLPTHIPTILVNGALDTISPPSVAVDFASRARLAGDHVDLVVLPGASHFDEVAASSASWSRILPLIVDGTGHAPPWR